VFQESFIDPFKSERGDVNMLIRIYELIGNGEIFLMGASVVVSSISFPKLIMSKRSG
jgi:hypothetical protein